jgi:hypothetical protein
MRPLVNVGDREDRTSNVCPVPVARTFAAEGAYGIVDFEWWGGSPHKLYVSAKAAGDEQLDVRGEGIEVYEDTAGSWLGRYSHVRRFSGNDFLEKPVPETFLLEIVAADGRLLETIQATYDTARCACAVPEAGRP